MTDLLTILPEFPTTPYSHLIPSLERTNVTIADLLTLDPVEIAKKCPLPLIDVRHLINRIVEALQEDTGIQDTSFATYNSLFRQNDKNMVQNSVKASRDVVNRWETISMLDKSFDAALGGGIPTGYITEVTGER